MAEPILLTPPPAINITVGPAIPVGSDPNLPVELEAHILDPTPHPAYDDQPDLVLIFENHLI